MIFDEGIIHFEIYSKVVKYEYDNDNYLSCNKEKCENIILYENNVFEFYNFYLEIDLDKLPNDYEVDKKIMHFSFK